MGMHGSPGALEELVVDWGQVQMGKRGIWLESGERRVLKEMTRKGSILGSDRNMVQEKLPEIYKDDPC